MTINVESQGDIPAVTLNKLQFDQFHFSTDSKTPNVKKVSARITPYGVADGSSIRIYGSAKPPLNISNLDDFIAKLNPKNQDRAAAALKNVQEGWGELASIYYGLSFTGVK